MPFRRRQSGPVDPLGPILVGPGGRGRVDLVAAHHQQPPARQRLLTGQRQLGGAQQRGDRVRGVEPVPEVGDEVQPQLVGGTVPVHGGRQAGLQLALVGE
jgi:hypothetical protein